MDVMLLRTYDADARGTPLEHTRHGRYTGPRARFSLQHQVYLLASGLSLRGSWKQFMICRDQLAFRIAF